MHPEPIGGFEWVQAPGGPALRCRPLDSVAPHLFTTRDWLLGLTTGEADGGWDAVAEAIGVERTRLVRLHQVHGAAVVVKRGGDALPWPSPGRAAERPHADILASDDPALALAVQTADCVALLIADRRTGAVAAAHAGWRGLAVRVPAVAVETMASELGSRPGDLMVAAGPSIGACCYEVGEDVRRRFEQAGFSAPELARWFAQKPQPTKRNPSMAGLPPEPRAGHWFFDGWTAVRDQLAAAGVQPTGIHAAELCTASHADAFCSYRRDGSPAGRMAAVIRRQNSDPGSPDPLARLFILM